VKSVIYSVVCDIEINVKVVGSSSYVREEKKKNRDDDFVSSVTI